MLKELVLYMAQSLVDKPEDVTVDEKESDHTIVYELSVNNDDLGKIIGKQGRTARAMRILLSAASARQQKRSLLEIRE